MLPDGCHLLGDSEYPSKKWLLTPYLRPRPGPQSNYNRCHKKTRSVVERGIAQLNRRFHVLHGEIRVSPPAKVCMVIEVCAMLHNICKDRNIGIPAGEDHNNGEEDDDQQPLEPPPRPREGLLYRDQFVNLHFNHKGGKCLRRVRGEVHLRRGRGGKPMRRGDRRLRRGGVDHLRRGGESDDHFRCGANRLRRGCRDKHLMRGGK
ncbi:hypothetical protein Pmani_007888 [Petrolisthes manimaculis]|uniref:DDE Tnp4 domain-containing protein n=1 Tax=Petrolisthes manimaculis TaxID=1843537 RepID=A0AAE1QA08_9EUCA|nr:hypothetical protein Pmani_007888 [Petrolisthes manimaculis]